MDLNERQLEFLEEELGISKAAVEKMTKKEWKEIREKCFWIEVEELLEIDKREEAAGRTIPEEPERCRLATSIVDYKGSFPWES